MKLNDWWLIIAILILIGIMVWCVFSMRTEGITCMKNPIEYAQKLNPQAICSCYNVKG